MQSIDRLGRNYKDIQEQWRILTKEIGTLSGASKELFLAIWKEREGYDRKLQTREVLSKMTGGGLGTAGGMAGAFVLEV